MKNKQVPISDNELFNLDNGFDDLIDDETDTPTLLTIDNNKNFPPTTSSHKRVSASRKNGALGGVKSLEGKSISSKNSLQFGIHSNKPNKMDLKSFNTVYSELAEKYRDTDPLRRAIITNMANIILRLDRCYFFEIDFFKQELDPPIIEKIDNPDSLEEIFNIPAKIEKIIHEGSPMPISIEKIEKLDILYNKIEGSLISKLIKYHKALTQDDI